jgi:hypothetical protein
VPAASERAQGLYRRLGFVAAGSMHSDIAVLRMYPQWYADAADEEEED